MAVDAADARLGRLLQLYMYEWTALLPRPLGADALYSYEGVERCAAYLFMDGATPVGFGLIAPAGDGWEVEELFVVVAARRRGVGAAAARALFATRPGRWTFTVRPENPDGLAFWRRVVPDADERVEVGNDGVTRTRFSFAVPRSS